MKSRELLTCLALSSALLSWSRGARGQACCAGTGAITPGRLALHEVALAGLQAKAGAIYGSFASSGRYTSSPPGASELDLEQDVFGAVRVLERGQVALLVPLIETRRTSAGSNGEQLSELGGGIGDLNLSVRYDFTLAGKSKHIPGIAALAGATLPTGTPPDAPNLGPLATGATGTGAWQVAFGLAMEQAFGPWLVNASGFVAQRTARTVSSGASSVHERLGAQWTVLAAIAYTFPNEAALAFVASYTLQEDATIDGTDAANTAERLPTMTLSGVLPISDTWRLQGALFDNPPIAELGVNQPAGAGLLATVLRSWI